MNFERNKKFVLFAKSNDKSFYPQGLREGGQGGDMPDIFEHLFGGGGGGGMGGMGGFFGMPFGGMGGMGGMGMSGMGGGRGGRRRAQKGEDTLHPLKYVNHFVSSC